MKTKEDVVNHLQGVIDGCIKEIEYYEKQLKFYEMEQIFVEEILDYIRGAINE